MALVAGAAAWVAGLAAADAARAQAVPATVHVSEDWALKPAGLDVGARFRLLFVSSATRDATSADIGDYNRFIAGLAASSGHAAIRWHAGLYRVVGSTAGVAARDNTYTTPGVDDVPVHWLGGERLATDYAGLYGGSWGSRDEDRFESGAENEAASGTDGTLVFTGTAGDGAAHPSIDSEGGGCMR